MESTCWFQQYFLGRGLFYVLLASHHHNNNAEHQNFIVDVPDAKRGPAIISIIQEYNGSKESEHARIIVRTKNVWGVNEKNFSIYFVL